MSTGGASLSHLGGTLRWPTGEPWPHCTDPHVVRTEHRIPDPLAARFVAAKTRMRREWRPGTPMQASPDYDGATRELAELVPGFIGVHQTPAGLRAISSMLRPVTGGSPLAPLAQLSTMDMAGLRGPRGTDLLQVLWCPNEHYLEDHYAGPSVVLRWRRAGGLKDLTDPPAPVTALENLLITPCSVHPEPVADYPWWDEITDPDLAHSLRDAADAAPPRLPGSKIGGWASWQTSGRRRLPCRTCGGPTVLLLKLAAGEPTGLDFGRHDELRIFACERCPATPPRLDLQ